MPLVKGAGGARRSNLKRGQNPPVDRNDGSARNWVLVRTQVNLLVKVLVEDGLGQINLIPNPGRHGGNGAGPSCCLLPLSGNAR